MELFCPPRRSRAPPTNSTSSPPACSRAMAKAREHSTASRLTVPTSRKRWARSAIPASSRKCGRAGTTTSAPRCATTMCGWSKSPTKEPGSSVTPTWACCGARAMTCRPANSHARWTGFGCRSSRSTISCTATCGPGSTNIMAPRCSRRQARSAPICSATCGRRNGETSTSLWPQRASVTSDMISRTCSLRRDTIRSRW